MSLFGLGQSIHSSALIEGFMTAKHFLSGRLSAWQPHFIHPLITELINELDVLPARGVDPNEELYVVTPCNLNWLAR